jgi:hypothetical protein
MTPGDSASSLAGISGPPRRLDAVQVQLTIDRLRRRILARFPDRNLGLVAGQLSALAGDIDSAASSIRARLRVLRAACRPVAVILVAAAVFALVAAFRTALSGPSVDWIPLAESLVNDLVFVAIAVYFLVALPDRLERRRLLRLLHRLRSLAHVIDMHQLTKDPDRLRPGWQSTSQSVSVGLNRDEMESYLDYCSEMLSLVGKVAALCAEESQDGVVLETVSTIETLTTGMSRKIWAKISLLPPAIT